MGVSKYSHQNFWVCWDPEPWRLRSGWPSLFIYLLCKCCSLRILQSVVHIAKRQQTISKLCYWARVDNMVHNLSLATVIRGLKWQKPTGAGLAKQQPWPVQKRLSSDHKRRDKTQSRFPVVRSVTSTIHYWPQAQISLHCTDRCHIYCPTRLDKEMPVVKKYVKYISSYHASETVLSCRMTAPLFGRFFRPSRRKSSSP